MRNKALIQKRMDFIKSEQDLKKAIEELADITFEIGDDACSERTKIKADVEKIRRTLLGNGDPVNSVIAKLEKVNECNDSLLRDVAFMKALLIGDISQGGDVKGFKERIKDVEEKVDSVDKEVAKINSNLSRLNWILISAVITQILAALFL